MDNIQWKRGKTLHLDIDKGALRALRGKPTPLFIDLELYFSCLIRKRVLISHQPDKEKDYLRLNDVLYVAFSPVMTKACAIEDSLSPELTTFPIKKRDAFLPKWLKISFKKSQFHGEFGY